MSSVFASLKQRFAHNITEFFDLADCIAIFRLKGTYIPGKRTVSFFVAFHIANCGIDDVTKFLDMYESAISKSPKAHPDIIVATGIESMQVVQRVIDREFAMIENEVTYISPDYIAPTLDQILPSYLIVLNIWRTDKGKPPILGEI